MLEEAEAWEGSWASPHFTHEDLIGFDQTPQPLSSQTEDPVFPICLPITLSPSVGPSLIVETARLQDSRAFELADLGSNPDPDPSRGTQGTSHDLSKPPFPQL